MPQRFFPEVRQGEQWIVERHGTSAQEHGPFLSYGEAMEFVADRKKRLGSASGRINEKETQKEKRLMPEWMANLSEDKAQFVGVVLPMAGLALLIWVCGVPAVFAIPAGAVVVSAYWSLACAMAAPKVNEQHSDEAKSS